MAAAKRQQSRLRSLLLTLETSPANDVGFPHGGDAVNWLWVNIPLMAVFFIVMSGVPLWLVFKHPDQVPAASRRAARSRQPRPARVYLPSNRDRYAQVGR
jgi:hypothetical protein